MKSQLPRKKPIEISNEDLKTVRWLNMLAHEMSAAPSNNYRKAVALIQKQTTALNALRDQKMQWAFQGDTPPNSGTLDFEDEHIESILTGKEAQNDLQPR